MIREVAVLHIKPGTSNDFESAFRHASPLLTSSRGYISHELHK
ncbi:antibiotic biosynthesis monooxygenase, partial [Paenibacillus sp.]